MTERIVFGEPQFDGAEEENVLRVLRSRWIGHGPMVGEFERRLAEYVGAPHVVAVSSCSAALHLALVAIGLEPGDEVITTPFTFAGTLNTIEHAGGAAVCVDIDRATLNLTPDAATAALTGRTRVVLPVHFGGRPVDVSGFRAMADEHGHWIVEDAAHAIGGWAAGERIGAASHPRTIVCFSFSPNENLASAEGGAITLSHAELASDLQSRRLHGLDTDAWARSSARTYRASLAFRKGFKCNWTDLQAAIALAQLEKLEGFLACRERGAEVYDELLACVNGATPLGRGPLSAADRHALHLYQVAIEGGRARRDAVVEHMKQRGIGAAVHYISLHRHPYYEWIGTDADFPAATWATESLISLPLHPGLSVQDQQAVVAGLTQALAAA